MNEKFDPFNDRTARDIRNSLSSAFIAEVTGCQSGAVRRTVSRWEKGSLPSTYRDYIRRTRSRYDQVQRKIRSEKLTDPLNQTPVLWNAGLFFELHELLETIWQDTRGDERTGLKGLIQAAGAYVHSLRGSLEAAGGLAARARRNIRTGRAHLGFIANLDELLENLEDPGQPPPELRP